MAANDFKGKGMAHGVTDYSTGCLFGLIHVFIYGSISSLKF